METARRYFAAALRLFGGLLALYPVLVATVFILGGLVDGWDQMGPDAGTIRGAFMLFSVMIVSMGMGLVGLVIYGSGMALERQLPNERPVWHVLRSYAGFAMRAGIIASGLLFIAGIGAFPDHARVPVALGSGAIFAILLPLHRRWQRATALDALTLQSTDLRPPVLYLRTFRDDEAAGQFPDHAASHPATLGLGTTEEQQLVEALSQIGPVIALADPGMSLQHLGAARLPPLPHDRWQEVVIERIEEAALVVIRASNTASVRWEIQQAWQRAGPEKTILLITDTLDFEAFRDFFQTETGIRLEPDIPWPDRPVAGVGAMVSFSREGEPVFRPVKMSSFLTQRLTRPAYSAFASALAEGKPASAGPMRGPGLAPISMLTQVMGFAMLILAAAMVVRLIGELLL